jgi:uncharacterized membrane protein
MSYDDLTYLHLATVVPAFLIGTWLLLRHKGTPRHRKLGKLYMVLMLVTAGLSLFMRSGDPVLLGQFGVVHLFVLPVAFFVPRAWFAVRRGDIPQHKRSMIGLYIGALLIAGAFAFSPGRLLHQWLFG